MEKLFEKLFFADWLRVWIRELEIKSPLLAYDGSRGDGGEGKTDDAFPSTEKKAVETFCIEQQSIVPKTRGTREIEIFLVERRNMSRLKQNRKRTK